MTPQRWLTTILSVLTLVVLGLVAALVVASKIVMEPGYPEQVRDAGLRVQERGFLLHNTSCDVLIYGDSTASIGVDPRVITANTGLSACNISAVRPVVDDLGLVPVDAFLAHNPKPRILVLQFGPELFYRKVNWDDSSPGAPIMMLLRDMPKSAAILQFLRHPGATVQFIQFVLQRKFSRPLPNDERMHQAYLRQIEGWEASNGLLTIDGPAQTSCSAPPVPLHGPLDVKWIHELRQKYQSQGIQVLIKASPIPECDSQLAKFQQELAPHLDVNVQPMPIQLFLPGDRHTLSAGSTIESKQLADAINARLK